MKEEAVSPKSAPFCSAAGDTADETTTAGNASASPRSPEDEADQERSSDNDRLAMSGLRVIDVGTFLAGPYAASILGEFGAEILKVEHPAVTNETLAC